MMNPSARSWSCILFDLDGTLTDSAPGILASLRHTFTELGYPVPDEGRLLRYVGPPLLDALRDFGVGDGRQLSDEEAWHMLEVYRTHAVDSDIDGNAVFPGVTGLLHDLHEAEIPLALATSKPESRARRILEHFDLAQYFTILGGASDDETRSAKADVVKHTLGQLRAVGVDTETPVMVGDRIYDVEGAAASNIPTVMVEWGYGNPDEARGALTVVHSTDQLRTLLFDRAALCAKARAA